MEQPAAPAQGFPVGRYVAGAVALALIALVLVSLTLGFRRDPKDIKTGTVGRAAPVFVLPRLDGPGEIDLAQYRGKVVVVNFWASWCIPCRQENPALAAVWERYRNSDVVLIGVLYQDTTDAAREYTTRLGNTWPSVMDEDGATAIAYGVFGIPETFFIGPGGIIAGRHVGPIDEQTLVNGIEALRPRR